MSRLRLTDSDTGESTLDIVKVPEGWSLQLATEPYPEYDGYSSIILSPEQMRTLIGYVTMDPPLRERVSFDA